MQGWGGCALFEPKTALTDVLNRHKQTPALLCFVLAVLMTLTAALSLSVGAMTTTPAQVVSHLWAALHGTESSADSAAILLIRLPRMVLALLIGAALAQSGAVTQGIFRNPMADPSLLGISSGAAFAAALVIVLAPGFAAFDGRSLPYIVTHRLFLRRHHHRVDHRAYRFGEWLYEYLYLAARRFSNQCARQCRHRLVVLLGQRLSAALTHVLDVWLTRQGGLG